MAKQTFTANQVLTAAQMNSLQANDYNWSVDTKTDSYVLVAGDAGKRIVMNAATAKTITVNTSIFTAGDTVWIHNINTGTCTVTAGTATVNTAGSLALAQWEGGALYFTSASTAIFFRGAGVSAANFSDTATGTYSSGGFNYKYITYTASGTLSVTKAGFADLLILGGGGGGGSLGGGGGAGGHLEIVDAYLPVGTLTITVGAGGAGAASAVLNSYNGVASRVGSYISPGGGFGGVNTRVGGTGGSGGGGGSTGASGITDFGNNGGTTGGSPSFGGGGGGGAGGAGANGTGTNGGNGGAGKSNSYTGSAVTRAGGGGGGSLGGTAGTGTDGGGNGTNNDTTAGSGTANTGSGGGSGGYVSTGGAGGAGGSGLVIVRVKT